MSASEKRTAAIRDYWRRQDVQAEIAEYATKHERELFRNKWEFASDKKNLYSRVRWEMDKLTAKMNEDLDKRRNRLSELLAAEERTYQEEEKRGMRQDPEEQHQQMIKRYAELKMQKEMKRQEIVREKKELQFKRNCGELRHLLSKKIQHETAEDERRLLLEREHEKKRKKQENALYEELWRKDSEIKRQKEEEEDNEKRMKDAANAEFVADQMKAKKLLKIKKLREKEDEAEIMEEQKRLFKLEREWEIEGKRMRQLEMKDGLDVCLRAKLKEKATKVQDDLAEDICFLKKLMDHEDEEQRTAKKKALLKEQQDYLLYLKSQMQKEAEFEEMVDRLQQHELEKIWKKREQEWDEEKRKRRQLEQDVMNEVKEQIYTNMDRNKQFECMKQSYAQKILEEDEADKRRDAEKLKLIKEKNVKYQEELLAQIRQNEVRLKEEKVLRERELEEMRRSKEEEDEKIRKLLSEIKIENEHPYRVSRRELFNDCKK